MSDQDTEAKLAKLTGIREDVIRAASFSTGKLTELYNKASESAKWVRVANIAMWVGAAGFVGNLVTAKNPDLGTVSTITLIAAFGGLATSLWSGSKAKKNSVQGEVKTAAENRLIELNRKDRGQAPDPAL